MNGNAGRNILIGPGLENLDFALFKNFASEHMPSIFDYAKTEEQRQLMRFIFSSTEFGRPYIFPPDVPKDRVQFMREAIARAVKDPELLAEAAKSKLDMTYRPPENLEKLVNQLYETPPALIEQLKSISPNLR